MACQVTRFSPIEHVFCSRRDTGELTAQMQRLWQDLPQGVISHLIESMPRRISACIAARVLWQTRTEWNEVVSDVFFTFGMMTQRTAPWENWHLERDVELLRIFGLVRWGLGESGQLEGTGEKLSFASQAAR
ncbi:hypothetical protein TNCV_5139911 [Trichonephila clavipes]|nr:hypothetical protein TNCV_5139911 [Trichonephila clavipes]